MLFYGELVTDTYRDIVNILIGTYVAALMKVVNYWFTEKDDTEHQEQQDLNTNGNGAGCSFFLSGGNLHTDDNLACQDFISFDILSSLSLYNQ